MRSHWFTESCLVIRMATLSCFPAHEGKLQDSFWSIAWFFVFSEEENILFSDSLSSNRISLHKILERRWRIEYNYGIRASIQRDLKYFLQNQVHSLCKEILQEILQITSYPSLHLQMVLHSACFTSPDLRIVNSGRNSAEQVRSYRYLRPLPG